jgi:hypothetical protein
MFILAFIQHDDVVYYDYEDRGEKVGLAVLIDSSKYIFFGSFLQEKLFLNFI